MSEVIQEHMPGESNSPIFLRSFWKRRLYGAFMVIMTFLDFRYIEYLKPDWQSGRLQDYAALFLSAEASLLFFPLILYSIGCFLLLMENQEQYAGKFFIRLGIYSGMFLALQYSLLVFLYVYDTSESSSILLLILVYVSPLILKKAHQWLSRKLSAVLVRNLAVGIAILIVSITILFTREPLFVLLIFLGFGVPFWSFLISGQTALWLFRNYETKVNLFRSLGFGAWIVAYVGALRFDTLKMYELYAALPTEPPNCYIATAAAQGHPRLVRSRVVHLRNGDLMQVNSQLQHFKSVEIALMAISPKLHSLVRKVYDVIGKKLAAYIQNPLLADVAFLFLLPVEWILFRMLKIFVPEIETISKKIYHS